MNNINDKEYESISPTAIVTSYPRSFTNIPYEKEIYNWIKKNIDYKLVLNKMLAPELEARYKLANKLLDDLKINQVLELASGYSSRGLIYSQKGFNYIEMDLAEVVNNKIKILESFTNINGNLHITVGNALDINCYKKCEEIFDINKEVVILNEGLLRYLTFEEKRIVAKNIFNTLSKFGGAWITCDVTPKEFIKSQEKNLPGFNRELTELAKRNNINDRFENKEHIIKFFGEIGFEVEFHYFKEVKNELSSPNILGISSTDVDSLLEHAIVAVMRIKENK